MTTTTNHDLAQRLRDACTSVRAKSYPLADLIPLMQQAADALSRPVIKLGAAPDELPEHVTDAVATALGDAYDCTRVWQAWSHGTMSSDDFRLVAEDGERVAEIAKAAIDADRTARAMPSEGVVRALWIAYGGEFHGPTIETGTMPEAKLLPFLQSLAANAGGTTGAELQLLHTLLYTAQRCTGEVQKQAINDARIVLARMRAGHGGSAVCATCNDNGMIGGPSYHQPDEGGVPCPECSTQAAPTEQQAYDMGAKGAPATDAERLLFEAWMRGHCWALCATWDGKGYRSDAEQGGNIDPRAMNTRQLWAAWRDRAALAAPQQPAVAAGREQIAEAALCKVLAAVQRYLPPDGPNANDTLSEIIEIVDPWPLGPLEKS